jgi:hypothetical protein
MATEVKQIINRLRANSSDKLILSAPIRPNEEKWSIADLFIRQYLNNGGDGFGMKNVYNMYQHLLSNKALLLKHNLISKDAWNNSGFILWEDYNF